MQEVVRRLIAISAAALIAASIALHCHGAMAGEQADDSHVYGRIVTDIRIIGLKTTKPFIVERELATKVGEPFTRENEEKDYERLDRLQIFSEVKIYAGLDDDGLVVFIEVRETFAYLPIINMSISDENGLSIGGGLKSVNLFGRATQFSGNARFGGETTVELMLRNPWFAGDRLGYTIGYYHRNRDNVVHGFEETADEASVLIKKHIGEYGRAGISLFYHRIKSDTDGRTLSADNIDNVIYASLSIGYDSRDLISNPHEGWWSSLDIVRSGLFGTQSDYWQGNLDLRRFMPLGRDHTVGIFSLYTATSGAIGDEVAPWQTFGFGGSNSIRGYDIEYETGKNQLINTVEYRWNFLQPRPFAIFGLTASLGMQLALFTDFGSVWDSSDEFGPDFIWGGGAGIRLLIPYVDLVRFDLGFGQDGSPSVIFHIGTGEKSERQRERVR